LGILFGVVGAAKPTRQYLTQAMLTLFKLEGRIFTMKRKLFFLFLFVFSASCYADSVLIGKWKGTYYGCGQGVPTNAEIDVCENLNVVFRFHAPSSRSGAFDGIFYGTFQRNGNNVVFTPISTEITAWFIKPSDYASWVALGFNATLDEINLSMTGNFLGAECSIKLTKVSPNNYEGVICHQTFKKGSQSGNLSSPANFTNTIASVSPSRDKESIPLIQTIAYVSPSRSKQSIRLIQADGSNDRLFWSVPENNLISPAVGTLAWSPDGSELAFDSDHNFGLSYFEREIYVTNGQTTRKIYRPIEAKQNAQYPKGTVKLGMNNGFDGGMNFWAYVEGNSDNHQWLAHRGSGWTLTFNEVADWGENISQHSILGYIDYKERRYCYYDLAAKVDVKAGETVTIPHPYSAYSHRAQPCYRFFQATWNYDGTKLLSTVIHSSDNAIGSDPSPYERAHENFVIALSDTKNIPLDNFGKKVGGFMQNFDHDPKFIKLSPTPEQKVLSVTYYSDADHIYLSSTNDPDLGVTDRMQRINMGFCHDRDQDYKVCRITDIEWLPDGNSFMVAMYVQTAYRSGQQKRYLQRIYQHNLKTSQTRLLFELENEYIGDFTISPDGQKIAFERGKRSDGPFAIWVYDTNNRGLAQLVADGAAPAWNSQ